MDWHLPVKLRSALRVTTDPLKVQIGKKLQGTALVNSNFLASPFLQDFYFLVRKRTGMCRVKSQGNKKLLQVQFLQIITI